MGNDGGNPERPYDLGERTALFGEQVIDMLKRVPENAVTRNLIDQLSRCSGSVGANYIEADDALSKKDFRYRVRLCRKESKECKHFLRLIARAHPLAGDEARTLWQEAKELNLIFGKMYRNSKENDGKQ